MYLKLNNQSKEFFITQFAFIFIESYRRFFSTLSDEDLFFLKNDLEKDIQSANTFINESDNYIAGSIKVLTEAYSTIFDEIQFSNSFKEKNDTMKLSREMLQILLNNPDTEHLRLCRSACYSFGVNLLKEDNFRFEANKVVFEKLRIKLQNASPEQIKATTETYFTNYVNNPLIVKMLEQGAISKTDIYQFSENIIKILAETKTPLQTE